ncbi:MAG: polyphosphate polymerase domain-containing protein [Oscillospiraceae bacterium]|nr:polyphosphate polymerase domain-containing protein [Oscillospiraceae bacterium]
MAVEVFNRYENKYLLDSQTALWLQDRLAGSMEPDAYNGRRALYTIANLYYDTDDSSLIRTSLAKPRYKEKLRLRAYGVPAGADEIYVEIKKKVRGLVNKRRSALPLGEAYAFLRGEPLTYRPPMNRQVLREAAYLIKRCALRPMLCLAYERRAYFGIGRHDLRVSFDTNLRARRTALRLEAGTHGAPLLDGGMWVMEIKVAQSIPVWLCRLLSEARIYPVSFSKYGTEYKERLRAGQHDRGHCDLLPGILSMEKAGGLYV